MDQNSQTALKQKPKKGLFAKKDKPVPGAQGQATPEKPALPKIKGRYPSKTSINLVYKEKNTGKNLAALGLFALFMVALAIFTKFMVIDQLAAVDAAAGLYNTRQQELAALQEANSVYDEVEYEYSHFGIGYLTDAELARHDRENMLNVIDDKVGISKGIRTIQISENTVTISFLTLELKDMSTIVSRLEESEYVSYVTVSKAATTDYTITYVDEFGNRIADVEDVTREAVTNQITVIFKTPDEVKAAQTAAEGGNSQ